tara:strand:+ start:47 stop:385 length:339 start_codon:yes stop_codon:yes gene_type:complete
MECGLQAKRARDERELKPTVRQVRKSSVADPIAESVERLHKADRDLFDSMFAFADGGESFLSFLERKANEARQRVEDAKSNDGIGGTRSGNDTGTGGGSGGSGIARPSANAS